MRVVGIIQCRVGSKRLPGKALLPLAGKPMIYRYIERCKRIKALDELVLATTEKKEDDVLVIIAEGLGIKTFRGSENDLVDRYCKCARKFDADIVVRLCADNPLLEPEEVDRLIGSFYISSSAGYMFTNTHNVRDNGYPDGLGAEVVSVKALLDFMNRNIGGEVREHPHKYFYYTGLVKTIDCPKSKKGYSDKKLDVNTQEEYDYIAAIYNRFGHNDFTFNDYKEFL